MQRFIAIFLMLFYTLSTTVCPMYDYSALGNLSEMYHHCKGEDPDLDIADFLVEHVMNLECVVDIFEHESENGEKPHQPMHQSSSISPVVCLVAKRMRVDHYIAQPAYEKKSYPLHHPQFVPSDFLSRVFRPPATGLI